ncbi:MAG: helix-turn-helix domain-containing protein [Enterocloster bolteae]
MVGEKIRKLRKEKKLTLKDIAEATGLSIGYISQLERGAVEPSLASLRKVSEFLGGFTVFAGGPVGTSSCHGKERPETNYQVSQK